MPSVNFVTILKKRKKKGKIIDFCCRKLAFMMANRIYLAIRNELSSQNLTIILKKWKYVKCLKSFRCTNKILNISSMFLYFHFENEQKKLN